MGAPSISINFIEQAQTATKRGTRGTIAMILVDSAEASYTIGSVTDIPAALKEENQLQIKLAMLGYITAPKKIYVQTIKTADDCTKALAALARLRWNYLAYPSVETDGKTRDVAAWIKEQREKHHASYKAVLPNIPSDYEGIVNVTNGCTYPGGLKLTPEKMCARAAGIICGTPLTMSCSYAPLPEMTDCDRMTEEDLNTAVESGKFVFFWDGEKVKVCRGVNSLTTTSAKKGDSFKKIKLVDAMDMIRDDITITAQDNYIGKYANNYDNKLLLLTAMNTYFSTLASETVIESGSCEIDIDANVKYYKEHGGKLFVNGQQVAVEDATETQLKQGQTGSYVFLKAKVALVDAIEDIVLDIYVM